MQVRLLDSECAVQLTHDSDAVKQPLENPIKFITFLVLTAICPLGYKLEFDFDWSQKLQHILLEKVHTLLQNQQRKVD